jgi:hypothetical protein
MDTHPYPEWLDADFAKFVDDEWKFKSLPSMSRIDAEADEVHTNIANPLHRTQHSPEL